MKKSNKSTPQAKTRASQKAATKPTIHHSIRVLDEDSTQLKLDYITDITNQGLYRLIIKKYVDLNGKFLSAETAITDGVTFSKKEALRICNLLQHYIVMPCTLAEIIDEMSVFKGKQVTGEIILP